MYNLSDIIKFGPVYIFRKIFKPTMVKTAGVYLMTNNLPYTTKEIIYKSGWESQERSILSQLKQPIRTVLELGTCLGFLSFYIEKKFNPDRIVSVEANPDLIDIIKLNAKLNNSKLELVNVIIGNEKEYSFFISENLMSSSLTRNPTSQKEVKVKGLSLNDLFKLIEPELFIIDIEGGEYSLLLNNEIPKCIKYLLIEFHGISSHSNDNNKDYIYCIDKLSCYNFSLVNKLERVHLFVRQ